MNPTPTDSTPLILARLRLITLALMMAQVMYVVVGWVAARSHKHGAAESLLVPGIALVEGLLLIAVSFLVARRAVTSVALVTQQFFLGFAIAEAGALIGLGVCFFTGNWHVVFLLAIATATAIHFHGRHAARRITELSTR
jgi:hypothetical protein